MDDLDLKYEALPLGEESGHEQLEEQSNGGKKNNNGKRAKMPHAAKWKKVARNGPTTIEEESEDELDSGLVGIVEGDWVIKPKDQD